MGSVRQPGPLVTMDTTKFRIDDADHHCAYIHTCVGKRNYLSFLVLLVSAVSA